MDQNECGPERFENKEGISWITQKEAFISWGIDCELSFLEGIWADAECIIIEGKIEKMKSNSHSIILPF